MKIVTYNSNQKNDEEERCVDSFCEVVVKIYALTLYTPYSKLHYSYQLNQLIMALIGRMSY